MPRAAPVFGVAIVVGLSLSVSASAQLASRSADECVAIIDYQPAQSPHRDQPALVVGRDQAVAWLADAGFKPIEDVPLFADKWFVVFGTAR